MQRREAREFVLTALYRHEFCPEQPVALFEDAILDPGAQRTYIKHTFQGVLDRMKEIDEILQDKTVGWRLERLALLDRNILRLGVYEILFGDDVPAEVAIDEAVELAKAYGTESAPRFVNGILDRVWREKRERNPS